MKSCVRVWGAGIRVVFRRNLIVAEWKVIVTGGVGVTQEASMYAGLPWAWEVTRGTWRNRRLNRVEGFVLARTE